MVAAGCAAGPRAEPNVEVAASDDGTREPRTSSLARHPAADARCPLQWPARDVSSGVHLTAAAMQPPMASALRAVCACTLPGEVTKVYADIDFAAGTVTVRAPNEPVVDGCLRELKPTFPANAAAVAGPDCIDCGPKHYGVLPGSQPVDAAAPASVRIRYPMRVDRSGEERR